MRCSSSAGFSDELALLGPVGVCAAVSTAATDSVQYLCRLGLRDGGVQDVLPAQSHQTPGLLLQLHGGRYLVGLKYYGGRLGPKTMQLPIAQ